MNQLIDVHVHLAALPDGDNGCYPQRGDAFSKAGGNVTQVAEPLGVSRATLQNKMKAYGLRDAKESKFR